EAHSVLEAERAQRLEESRLRLARAEVIPDVTLRAGLGYDRGMDEAMVGAGVEIPIPLFNRNQGRIRESQRLIASAQQRNADSRNTVQATIAQLLQRINESDTLSGEYRTTLVPMAEKNLEEVLEQFAGGEASLTDALDTLRSYIAARNAYLGYLRMLNTAHAELRAIRSYDDELGADPSAPAHRAK
ncbi:MAG TPA: TolC family protein, partial [Gemmatimonadales bacterium]|nr:TolC family protein [Gemmatimonadales bacterium]